MDHKLFIKLLFCIPGLLIFHLLPGQDTDVYSLLTERYVDRPINIHRGQLQVNSGYKYSLINKKFDAEGTKIDLTEDGSPAAEHLVPLEIKFGLLEHLQLTAAINYASLGMRDQNRLIITDEQINIDGLNEYKGLDDLYLGLDFRAPFGLKKIDWNLSGGLFLPITDHYPEQPDHSIQSVTIITQFTQVNYHFRNKYTDGVMKTLIGTSLKAGISKFSVLVGMDFLAGLKDGESIFWTSRQTVNGFDYESLDYQYNPGQQISYNALLVYQAIDWFAVMGSFTGLKTYNGWSNETGKKIGYPEKSYMSAGVGYEIMVTPNMRLFQMVDIPVAGKDYLGFLVVNTGISLNLISEPYHNLF